MNVENINENNKENDSNYMTEDEAMFFINTTNKYIKTLPTDLRIHKGMTIRLSGEDKLITEHRRHILDAFGEMNKDELIDFNLHWMVELGVIIAHKRLNDKNCISDDILNNTAAFIKELQKLV